MTNANLPVPNDPHHSPSQGDVKRFATLQATFAMLGLEFVEVGLDDGSTRYCLREGAVSRVLNDLNQAYAVLLVMSGVSPEVGQVKPPGGACSNADFFADLLPEARMATVKKRLLRHGLLIEKEIYGEPSWLRVFSRGSQRALICRDLEHAERYVDRLDKGLV